ncbi:MAG TPA: PP2C family protein-serine/threonine phosphatase [Terriglobales bacterium]|jgi:sigma-B regulation protein RsbU (phosphoserine phosphatase)|nr:PP2C family protein-serine/threonine phosphatase [Terriglobales bacterium]
MKFPTQAPAVFYEAVTEALYRCRDGKTALLLKSNADTETLVAEFGLLHRDLEIARKVQKASFPQKSPAIPGLQCATFYRPAHSIGGDYYDFLPLDDGTWGIAVGDVSGKGLGAALVMATLQASLRAQTLAPRPAIRTLMKNVNLVVRESSPAEFFASLFYAEYEPVSRLLTYVNAGHNPPVVARRSYGRCKILSLQSGGVPVGALDESHYDSETFQLEPGDLLIAYTDGLTESENPGGSAFGQERLKRILCSCTAEQPQEILQHILQELSAHSAGCPQADDLTLVVIRVETECSLAQCTSPLLNNSERFGLESRIQIQLDTRDRIY